jgi:hypothetical protein
MEQIIKNSIDLFNPFRVDEKPGYIVTVDSIYGYCYSILLGLWRMLEEEMRRVSAIEKTFEIVSNANWNPKGSTIIATGVNLRNIQEIYKLRN